MTGSFPPPLRRGVPADSEAIARVHVASWEHAYRGILPDSVLEAHTIEGRRAKWEGWFRNGDHSSCWVAEDAEGRIIGFGSGGPERTGEQGIDAELYTLYLAPSHVGQGVGTRLFRRIWGELLDQGHGSMLTWVLESNTRAKRFYERIGGERMAEKVMRFRGSPQTVLAFAWRDLVHPPSELHPDELGPHGAAPSESSRFSRSVQ